MLTKKILLVIASAVALAACDAVNEPQVSYGEKVAGMDPNYVPMSLAVEVANNYVKDKGIIMLTKSKELQIKDSFSFTDDNDLPALHTINYEEGGFVIVSGDERTYPVLAYSEDGYLPQDYDSYPGGLKIWIEDIRADIDYLRNKSDETDSLTKYIWERFEKENPATRSQPADTEYWNNLYDNSVGPLLSTTWHQTSPYNNYLPYISNGQHAYVGCVPVAIAQIMRYFEYPSSYSWSQMPNNSANSHLYSLIDDIWSHLGVGINLHYDTTGTSVSHNYNIANYLKNEFGYSTASQMNYTKNSNYTIVRNELIDYERPVIFKGTSGGEGHAWVCDGAHEWQEDIIVNGQHNVYGYLRFHHVWGGSTSYNGWYAFTSFAPTNSIYDFGHNMKLVYNINP